MRPFIILALLLASAHCTLQDEGGVDRTIVVDEEPVQLPARDIENEEALSERSTQGDVVEEKDDEEKAVQLPARDIGEEFTQRSQGIKKCGKKCGRNAECVKGKCRCKKGYRKSLWRQRCVRKRCGKCGKNARCFRGRCRCRRGYQWNKAKKQCVKSKRNTIARDIEDEEVLPPRSTQVEDMGEEVEEKPVQLPARSVNEDISKRSQKGSQRSFACENRNLRLRCGRGRQIQISNISYKRNDKRCSVSWYNCWSGKSRAQIRKSCNGRQGCFVWGSNRCKRSASSVNVVYTCRKINKCKNKKCGKNARCVAGRCRCRRGYQWNKARKQCVKKNTILWFKVGKGTVCEHETLTLRCSKGRVIRVFYSLYGRRNRQTCGKGKPIKTTKCQAKNARKIAKKNCEGKQTCRLRASNKVFGDPCKGTFKYLTVVYGCRKRCAKNAFFNGKICKCKKGYRGNGYKKCTKRKIGRDLGEEEKRDVSEEEAEISEDGLERA